MNSPNPPTTSHERIVPAEVSSGARYELLTSLVVPRPIGWLSTRSAEGIPNLAPFSYFVALAASPLLIGVSIGHRRNGPKDSLRNIRERGAFCVNIVTEPLLEAMNVTSGEYPPEVDEFERADLELSESTVVDAPYVARCPAVMECTLFREVDLGGAPATFLIGRAESVLLSPELERVPGMLAVRPESLRPVARFGGPLYGTIGEIFELGRPGSES